MRITSKANQSQGMLMFKLSLRQSFAIGTLKVREIVPYLPMTQIPNSPQFVIGTISIRGVTVPVIDMAAAIGFRAIQPEEYAQCVLIVTDCLRTVVAFMVRSIDKIVECDWKKIEPSPNALGKDVFVTGIARFQEQLIQLLDVELLLAKIYPHSAVTKVPRLTDFERETLKSMQILLVDDSLIARRQLADALDAINVPYQMAHNGHEALTIMRNRAQAKQPIQLLVSDIEMPGLDGYELCFEVQNDALLQHCYRILHTSLSSEMCVERAQQVGAHEALEKFHAEELIKAMLIGAKYISSSSSTPTAA